MTSAPAARAARGPGSERRPDTPGPDNSSPLSPRQPRDRDCPFPPAAATLTNRTLLPPVTTPPLFAERSPLRLPQRLAGGSEKRSLEVALRRIAVKPRHLVEATVGAGVWCSRLGIVVAATNGPGSRSHRSRWGRVSRGVSVNDHPLGLSAPASQDRTPNYAYRPAGASNLTEASS